MGNILKYTKPNSDFMNKWEEERKFRNFQTNVFYDRK